MDTKETLEKFKKTMAWGTREEILQTIQALELEKHTEILNDAKNITKENAEYVKRIAQLTLENQKISTRQFWASIIVSSVALIIAIASFIVTIVKGN